MMLLLRIPIDCLTGSRTIAAIQNPFYVVIIIDHVFGTCQVYFGTCHILARNDPFGTVFACQRILCGVISGESGRRRRPQIGCIVREESMPAIKDIAKAARHRIHRAQGGTAAAASHAASFLTFQAARPSAACSDALDTSPVLRFSPVIDAEPQKCLASVFSRRQGILETRQCAAACSAASLPLHQQRSRLNAAKPIMQPEWKR